MFQNSRSRSFPPSPAQQQFMLSGVEGCFLYFPRIPFHGAVPGAHGAKGCPHSFSADPTPLASPSSESMGTHRPLSALQVNKEKDGNALKTYVVTIISLELLRNTVSNGIFEARGGIPMKPDLSEVSKWSSCVLFPRPEHRRNDLRQWQTM